jgi:hypothetical protein
LNCIWKKTEVTLYRKGSWVCSLARYAVMPIGWACHVFLESIEHKDFYHYSLSMQNPPHPRIQT